MNGWSWFWLTLGVIAVIGEGIALARAPGGTLSEQVWHWLKVTPGKTSARAALQSWRALAVGGFLVWLLCHLVFGMWR